jgi:hypothetical protein
MFSCDYNGWADVPEDEREELEAFESSHTLLTTTVHAIVVLQPSPLSGNDAVERRAA